MENKILEVVWYSGTDTLLEGEGVCYNTDLGTATLPNARRGNYVERPSSSNNGAFAGVAARSYIGKTGALNGRMIEICIPGSVAKVALGVDTVLGVGRITCQAGGAAGRFVDAGFAGRGSAFPLQTVTAILEGNKAGSGSLLATDGKTLTVADSSDMAVGDTVVFLAGEDDATGALVPGKYAIASITDTTHIVLATMALDVVSTGAITCSFYIYTGNPTCMCRLEDGPESGLVEWISPVNAGNADQSHMVGGVTYVNGGITIGADVDIIPADGTLLGEKKGIVLMGAMTTNDLTIVPASAGIVLAGTALTEVLGMDVAGDAWYAVWNGKWRTDMVLGGATEA
jgi:hypothetical protein